MKHLLTDDQIKDRVRTKLNEILSKPDAWAEERFVAQAQYDLLLSHFPKNEDIKVMLFQYTQGERTLESVVEYIKRGTFGDAE